MLLLRILLSSTSVLATQLNKRAPESVPSFVVDYAPIIYLHSQDPYLPSDISAQLANTEPRVDFTAIGNIPSPLTLDNLAGLNSLGGENVYLTSKIKPNQNPEYLRGVLPDQDGKTTDAVSSAIIVNDHKDGTVDAFYFYFTAFDYGGEYLGHNIGNHVGDWEHNMIRFVDQKPKAIWYSQHANGQAFEYDAVDKYNDGLRPIAYSANGSHAVYATDGTHAYGIPNVNLPAGLIEDHTDHGPRYDPVLSAYFYSYDRETKAFTAYNAEDPINWLSFIGHWGDERYPDEDESQECVLGIDALCKYTNGPTGPIDKQLDRKNVCPDNGNLCIVRKKLVQRNAETDPSGDVDL